jgi:hypothetical protein
VFDQGHNLREVSGSESRIFSLPRVQGLASATFDNNLTIAESRIPGTTVNLKLDLPDDLFDTQFTAADFAARVRELAILELVRTNRLHEHEAKEMLALERWELVERMKAAGIAPTEDVFSEIKGELKKAIDSKRARRAAKPKR